MGDDSFKLITWKDHTEERIKLVSKAKDYIEIVSPWIMGSTYWCFFNNISDNIKLSVIFRWPTENDDEKFYDLELLETLFHKGNVDVQWVGTSHPLHAKVYHVKDIGAIVTSANMTDKGFSKKDIIRWKQKNKKRVYGLILVPVVKNSEGIKEYNKESAPIAFIPFSDLFSRNNFAITPFLHGYKKYKYLQLHLAQEADNEWVLKNAGKYKKEISAEPYLNTTSKMKNSHINL